MCGNPNSRKSEMENGRKQNNLPQHAHAWNGSCRVAIQPLDHRLIIALEDDMGARPCVAPTQNCLQYSKDLLELNVAVAEAPGTPRGEP
jgi:hypothetical protein